MQQTREYLELAYFLSGPIVAILAAWGLRQITVARNSARLTAKREAFRLSAEQCRRFMEQLIPRMNEFDSLMNQKPLQYVTDAKTETYDNGFKVQAGRINLDDPDTVMALSKAIELINSLESFAVFFTSGVAAEEVVFPVVGKTYCREVETLLPVVAIGASNSHYHNLLTLFFTWRGRLIKGQLITDKAHLESRIRNIRGKTITPMGLED